MGFEMECYVLKLVEQGGHNNNTGKLCNIPSTGRRGIAKINPFNSQLAQRDLYI